MIRALLLFKLDLTDRHQPATAICGAMVVLMLLAIAHAKGWL